MEDIDPFGRGPKVAFKVVKDVEINGRIGDMAEGKSIIFSRSPLHVRISSSSKPASRIFLIQSPCISSFLPLHLFFRIHFSTMGYVRDFRCMSNYCWYTFQQSAMQTPVPEVSRWSTSTESDTEESESEQISGGPFNMSEGGYSITLPTRGNVESLLSLNFPWYGPFNKVLC